MERAKLHRSTRKGQSPPGQADAANVYHLQCGFKPLRLSGSAFHSLDL